MKNSADSNFTKPALKLLQKLIAFKSISTESKYKQEVKNTAEFIKQQLVKLNFKVEIIPTKLHPLLFAEKNVGAQKTLGIYSHYDVQPPDPLAEWHSQPFSLTLKNNKLYGRGVADDKGHIAQTLSAIKEVIREKSLKNNLVLIYEGEEEVSSPNFTKAISGIQQRLKNVDCWYILDSEVRDKQTPMLIYGLRGIMYYELKIKSAKYDLHSGIYGNLAPNSAQILAYFLAKLKNENGRIALPNFYDDVSKPTDKELQLLKMAKDNPENTKKIMTVKDFLIPEGQTYETASKLFPSLEINGFYSGFIGEGEKTIIPSRASAKFSFRLVPKQKIDKIDAQLQKFTYTFFNQYPVDYQLQLLNTADAFVTELDNKFVKQITKIFNQYFQNSPIFNRSGGSIPAAGILSHLFNKPVIITGFTSPESALHAPNENIDLELFEKGIRVLKSLFSQ